MDASIHTAPAATSWVARAARECAQERGRREKASLNRRSPVESPTFASSPTSSTADATSSAPPGGWTEPVAVSLLDSNPCLGAASRLGAEPLELFAALLVRFGEATLAVVGLRGPTAGFAPGDPTALALTTAVCDGALGSAPARAALLRAAARRGLECWGRVLGRLTRTPRFSRGVLDRWLPLASLTGNIIA